MEDKQQQIWRAKRLMVVAARATAHAAKRIRLRLPAKVALQRSNRLIHISANAFREATA
jgi:hypothetical protein